MENGVPSSQVDVSLAARSVDRALEGRRAAYADEVRRLVEASFALIRETGEFEPRVSEIVRAAGLSNQAFYRHFRSKDELLVTVLDEGIRRLESYLRHVMAAAASPEQKIREWIAGVLEQALDPAAANATRPFALARGRLAERFPQEVEESERRLTALLEEAVAAAVARGDLPRADPERDAAALYDLTMGWLQRQLLRSERPAREDAEQLVEFAVCGMRRGSAR